MKIDKLQFENFRNLINGSISPCEGINVFYGNNAQGKTNLLEAIWLFCGGHSFRNNKENELIKFNEKFYKLSMKFFSHDRDQKAEIIFQNGKRKIKINGIERNKSSYLTEIFSAIVFFPDHLDLIKNNPGIRRNFLDTAICQQRVKYAISLGKYKNILNQRNALLKESYTHRELRDTIFIWDDILAQSGALILKERIEYIKKLKIKANEYHKGISDNKENLEIKYLTKLDISEDDDEYIIKEKFLNELKNTVDEDIRYGHTGIGPHRDDILISINGKSAKTYCSQGQQRSAVLSMKLSEAKLLSERNDEKPVILLDDVLSELDSKRQDYLLNRIEGYQVFVTCCEKSNKEQLKNGKVFYIENGEVKE